MDLIVKLTEKEWQRVLKERRYELGEDVPEDEVKSSVENDLRDVVLSWYPERWIIQ